ncbi:MAG: Gfo/Idh/MocA family oxidoreductase [Ruminococcaceae bacterium]|nr:Gfo/Idh/MocA family oxidoreductase [Oscillospiraceae bacterium]
MKRVKIGVLGAYRGTSLINYCKIAENAEVVAICEKNEATIARHKAMMGGDKITYYTEFDQFLTHDMDAVVLANYATEHAPFAIKCLRAGKHVYSEVLPCQTMKEAVELVEAVEETGLVYAYGENFCYMPAPFEMSRLYREGAIGELEYAECEYGGSIEPEWPCLTYGNKDHWRNNTHANFYCTHSLGPIIHMTGLRPVRVTGFEGKKIERNLRVGAKAGQFGIEMVELENGALIKSLHGYLYNHSTWYTVYGSKGRMESAREDAHAGSVNMLYVNNDEYSGQYRKEKESWKAYEPVLPLDEKSKAFGHGGGDFYAMHYFAEKILGDDDADIIDVYEALDMGLAGMFAYRSVLQGGVPVDMPNLRDKAERDKWRNDTMCTDPKVAGDMLIPSFSLGNPDIPDEVYDRMKALYQEALEQNTGHVAAQFLQNSPEKINEQK